MFRRLFLGLAVLAGLALVGASAETVEARGCGGYSRGYSSSYYPSHRTSYYGGGHHHGVHYSRGHHYAPVVYQRSYHGGHHGGYHGHHGHRSGVSFSFGF